MDKSLAVMEDFEGFFSFFARSVKGIHGTAILTKSEATVPLKAEEGLATSLLPAALTESERIGGYPLGSDVDLTFDEMKDLDAEGRTTVCDFGLFVLINLRVRCQLLDTTS
jgi:AP endonuclease 2